MTDEDIEQEKNMEYVAVTRAKKNLYLVEEEKVSDDAVDSKNKNKNIEKRRIKAHTKVEDLLSREY